MKGFVRFLLLAVLPIGVLVAVAAWSPLLTIRTLHVTGQERCTTGEILAASELGPGVNPLFPVSWRRGAWPATNLAAAVERVRKLPWIASAHVDWMPLHAVRIRVSERVPYALLPYLGGSLVIDSTGVVLESATGDPPTDLREIRGIRFSGYANGRVPETEDSILLRTGIDVLRALRQNGSGEGPSLYGVVRWVDVLAADRVLVSLEDRVIVRFDPTVDLQYKVDFTGEIFFRHILPEERGLIDFTRGDDPAFIPE